MNKAKHTPGPWAVLPDERHRPYIRIRGTRLGRRHPIASVLVTWRDEAIANAQLIAAAPKMLEALEEAQHAFLRYAEIHSAKKTPEGDRKAAENSAMARRLAAAIAAAKGEG